MALLSWGLRSPRTQAVVLPHCHSQPPGYLASNVQPQWWGGGRGPRLQMELTRRAWGGAAEGSPWDLLEAEEGLNLSEECRGS